MTSQVRLVVFDVDDTLYLERSYVKSGFDAVGQYMELEHGVSGFGDRLWRLFMDGVRGNTFDTALSAMKIDLDVDRLISLYRAHRPRIEMLDDARRCLDRVPEGMQMGIVTDGPAISQRAKLTALGLDLAVPNAIVTSEHGQAWAKPSPLAFEHLMQSFGHGPDQCVYVADNPAKDFQGPASIGWRTVRVRRRLSLHYLSKTPVGTVEVVCLDRLWNHLGAEEH